jgi:RNA polymerase sigma-70 factor (ECF subfamily)
MIKKLSREPDLPSLHSRAELRLLKLVPPALSSASFVGSDAELVAAFLRDDPRARAALYGRYAEHVLRVLRRILGARSDLADLHHDVFVRAVANIAAIEDPSALKGWLTMIAVHVARTSITRRRQSGWLLFFPSEELPEVAVESTPPAVLDAVRATYATLDALSPDDRVAFALRYLDGMELTEIAAACHVSLATLKRRLARAETRFVAKAKNQPALVSWLEGGTRWGRSKDR